MKKQQQNQYLLDKKNGMKNCRMGNIKTHASLGLAQGKGHWQLHVDQLISFYVPESSAFDVAGVEDNTEVWHVT